MTDSNPTDEATEKPKPPEEMMSCFVWVHSGKTAILFAGLAALMLPLLLEARAEGDRIMTLFFVVVICAELVNLGFALWRYIKERVYRGQSEVLGEAQPRTVGELIEELEQRDPGQLVLVEGETIGLDPLQLRSSKAAPTNSPPGWMGLYMDPEHPAAARRRKSDEVHDVLVLARASRSRKGAGDKDE